MFSYLKSFLFYSTDKVIKNYEKDNCFYYKHLKVINELKDFNKIYKKKYFQELYETYTKNKRMVNKNC